MCLPGFPDRSNLTWPGAKPNRLNRSSARPSRSLEMERLFARESARRREVRKRQSRKQESKAARVTPQDRLLRELGRTRRSLTAGPAQSVAGARSALLGG